MKRREIFFDPRSGRIRAVWRVGIFLIICLAAQVVVTVAAGVVFIVVFRALPMNEAIITNQLGDRGYELAKYGINIAATLIGSAICLRWLDRRRLRSLGYQLHRRWWCDYLIGVGVSLAMITLVVVIEIVAGSLTLGVNPIPAASVGGGLFVSFGMLTVAACFEELLFRGYPLQTLLMDVRPVIALVIPSVLFGLAHSLNPGSSRLAIINTVIAGVWLSVAYYKTRSLWLPTGMHFAWNYAMGAIYGLNISGLDETAKNAVFRASDTGPHWLTGGTYGPEGGVVVTVVFLLGTIWLWRVKWLQAAPESLAGLQPIAKESLLAESTHTKEKLES